MERRALISLHDKTGLVELARALVDLGFELVASGGTARVLKAAELPVRAVEELTGFPEVLEGRVKTLHPAIHAGILARGTEADRLELDRHGIGPIELVVCNLYPFVETVASPTVSEGEAVEQIDIGGVTLLRAAAKNHARVTVLCDPRDYPTALDGMRQGELPPGERRRLAGKAFRHTAAYDAAIASWFGRLLEPEEPLPEELHLTARRELRLRYGENPHQAGALYRWVGTRPVFRQLQGKELSYNNLLDLDAAWGIPGEFAEPAVAIVKHGSPCGLAVDPDPCQAFRAALECDPLSAFGSILAVNRPVDARFVREVGKLFVEVLAAPAFEPEALEILARRKKNCRVMVPAEGAPDGLVLRSVPGGLLAQTPDRAGGDSSGWRTVTRREPTPEERAALAFAWLAVKHVRSNGIALARGRATVGIGPGQPSRVDSVRIAVGRAGQRARGAVLGSDAFFPFPDGVEEAAGAGVSAVIQPGGSKGDPAVIEAADRLGLAMIFTGERHFRH